MGDGARTRDRTDHNRVLYQLSYAHRTSIANERAGKLGAAPASVNEPPPGCPGPACYVARRAPVAQPDRAAAF